MVEGLYHSSVSTLEEDHNVVSGVNLKVDCQARWEEVLRRWVPLLTSQLPQSHCLACL